MMTQRGYNDLYPKTIEIWKRGETVPEWLSDRSKISEIKEDGTLVLGINELNTGGYEIKDSSGTRTLIQVKHENDVVCFGDDKLFSLNPVQLELLYE